MSSFFAIAFVMLLTCVQKATGQQHWALLVAGSKNYDNYRHQADVCHAYHVLRNHGFSKEHIIVMMVDDVAYSEENPFPGQLINHPDGPNVHKGVTVDYAGDEVRPDVFLSVLSGNVSAVEHLLGRHGRVIKSGPNDQIFLNFVDHGGPGMLAFPNEFLHADELHQTLTTMYMNNQYRKMVLYIEACYSGSMFDGILEDNLNVFVTTAADPDESSYAVYFDKERETFLGDLYSVNWMEDSDKENLREETLSQQFKLVQRETNKSHVMEYGDLTLGAMTVAEFQGNQSDNSLRFIPSRKRHPAADAVPSEEVPIEILKWKLSKSSGDEKIRHNKSLTDILKRKDQTEEFFKNIASLSTHSLQYESILNTRLRLNERLCYKESVRLIRLRCPGLKLVQNDFALRQLKVLANLCDAGISMGKVWSAVDEASNLSDICG